MSTLSKFMFAATVGLVIALSIWSSKLIQIEPNLPVLTNQQTPGPKVWEPIIKLVGDSGYYFCTASVLDSQYALTAAHCVVDTIGDIDKQAIHIWDMHDVYTGVIARAVAIDNLRDVALIRGEFGTFKTVTADWSGKSTKLGMHMISCGFPSGETLHCAELVHEGNYYFQYKTRGGPIFKGMSGGAVFSKDTGYVIGVNSAVTEDNVIISPLVGALSTLRIK